LLISSHELLEVELISNRIGILFEGVMQTSGTMDELLTNRDVTLLVSGAGEAALARVAEKGLTAEDRVEDRVKFRVAADVSVYDALAICKAEGLNLISVAPRRETLEELFVRVVGAANEQRRKAS